MSRACTSFCANSNDIATFFSAKPMAFWRTSLAPLCAAEAWPSMLFAAFCAAVMKPSKALRACSTLCSANARISRGISKCPVASFAIPASCCDDGTFAQLLCLNKEQRRRTLHAGRKISSPRRGGFAAGMGPPQNVGSATLTLFTCGLGRVSLRHRLAGRGVITNFSFTVNPCGAFAPPVTADDERNRPRRVHARTAACGACHRPLAGVVVGGGRGPDLVGERGWSRRLWRADRQRACGAPVRRQAAGCAAGCAACRVAAVAGQVTARTAARLCPPRRRLADVQLRAAPLRWRDADHSDCRDRAGRPEPVAPRTRPATVRGF